MSMATFRRSSRSSRPAAGRACWLLGVGSVCAVSSLPGGCTRAYSVLSIEGLGQRAWRGSLKWLKISLVLTCEKKTPK